MIHTKDVIKELSLVYTYTQNRDIPLYGISDSAFHTGRPDYTYHYPLDPEFCATYDLYRFGYHGLSVESITHILSKDTERNHDKMIVCHLGGGVSITALRSYKTVQTSMGATPLEGPPMPARVGSIDPTVALLYHKHRNDIYHALYTQAGLKALTGSHDMKHIVDHIEDDPAMKHALELFTHAIAEYIAGYTIHTKGIDTLVFTGGIGEHSSYIRAQICSHLTHLGIHIDTKCNTDLSGHEAYEPVYIHTEKSICSIAVIKTQEMNQIYTHTTNMAHLSS
jgi:acetate kinase